MSTASTRTYRGVPVALRWGLMAALTSLLVFVLLIIAFLYHETCTRTPCIPHDEHVSPSGLFTVTEDIVGDHNRITIRNKAGVVIVDDLVSSNNTIIGS